MLFRKYRIVIFKEGKGDTTLAVAGLVWRWPFFAYSGPGRRQRFTFLNTLPKAKSLENQLVQTEKIVEEQNTQLINLSSKVRSMQADMTRVQQFNSNCAA